MPDLEALLEGSRRRPRNMSPERRKEINQRNGKAQGLARVSLVALHRDDYDDLYRQAKAKVDAERGPLPD